MNEQLARSFLDNGCIESLSIERDMFSGNGMLGDRYDCRCRLPVSEMTMDINGRIFIDHDLPYRFRPKKVLFKNPATIVYWSDGDKTVVICRDNIVDGRPKAADTYSKEMGLALCFMKKACGNTGKYNKAFKKWIEEDHGQDNS